ncbi:MAG: hypothetical protein KDN19_17530 [Verrucomicrobiae bacterium]|nr:hypothetical protein [Verrucomicrobiae bacterium]
MTAGSNPGSITVSETNSTSAEASETGATEAQVEPLPDSDDVGFDKTPDEETREFLELDPEKVLRTVTSLKNRILERFPDSGLSRVCGELERVSARSKRRIEWISQPMWALRSLRYLLLAMILAGIAITIVGLRPGALPADVSLIEWIQTLEAGINDVVLISLAVFFVWGLEARLKRKRALQALHELRSIAHVIDMHQLTKDPDRLISGRSDTRSSPKTTLNAFLLRRYLDYCSEMLSLVGKVAALYVQKLEDSTVVATVNEIENLTTGLSEKIWQKIDMLSREK